MGGFTPAHYAVKFGYDKIVDWREPPPRLSCYDMRLIKFPQFLGLKLCTDGGEKRDRARLFLTRSVFNGSAHPLGKE